MFGSKAFATTMLFSSTGFFKSFNKNQAEC